ncbi:MAG: hypothetical protein KZQ83_05760 [gamma proteobacterium symbiont of Taylorina sp.]|nr:hypothetical protein [gamma proteobacterium symbiont of Taylorina sp.]
MEKNGQNQVFFGRISILGQAPDKVINQFFEIIEIKATDYEIPDIVLVDNNDSFRKSAYSQKIGTNYFKHRIR